MPRFRSANNRGLRSTRRRAVAAVAGWMLVSTAPHLFAARCVEAAGDAARGAAVFAMAGGCGCHTGPDGPVGAGGGEVPTPFGKFYGTNITPDPETGIGKWTDAQVAAAIRDGRLPDGSTESPAMPYYRYAGMSDADIADLIVYLRTLPPVRRNNRPHEVTLPLPRLAYRAWRILFVPAVDRPATAPAEKVARGRYLVDHVAICGDCHTPRNRLGASDDSRYLGGTRAGPDGVKVPNITPHATGIGDWDPADITSLLELGMLPDFDNVQGLMAEVIDGKAGGPGYGDAPSTDREAIAAYLKTVAPLDHDVSAKGDD